MDKDDIDTTLAFLKHAERLKDTMRSAHTSGGRRESTAEHTWRLCLWVIAFADELAEIDFAKLLKICVVHDLAEAIGGDMPAVRQTADGSKAAKERADLETLTEKLRPKTRAEIIALWEEYESATSAEGRIAKGFDKLETILQHIQGQNPADFDYAFNLSYGLEQTSADSLLARIRNILDGETRARMLA